MTSERKKLSIFRPLYSNVNSRFGLGRHLTRNLSNTCDIIYKRIGPWDPKSIYHHTHTIFTFLGFGIAWGYDYDANGNHYIQKKHVVRWSYCEYGCIASRTWIGRMEVYL